MRQKLLASAVILVIGFISYEATAQDDPAKVAQQRLATLQAIQDQRFVLLQRRENLSQQVVPIQNQLKVLNGQLSALTLECRRIETNLAQLQQANNQLDQQRPAAIATGQVALLDATIQQNIADGRALEVRHNALSSQLSGVAETISGLNAQLRDAEIAVRQVYAEADQLRIEWLRLMDPFGRFAQAEHEAAILIFTEWIILDGQNSGAFLARGFAYWQLQEFDKALADFDRAVQLGGPLAVPALAGRGGLRHAMGNRREGLVDLGRALKLDKTDAMAYLLRARARMAEGNYRMALSDLKIVARLNGRDPDAQQQLALILAACPQDNIRNGKKAMESAKLACELTKWKDWNCLDTLAAAHAELGQFDEAVKWQRKAIQIASAEKREVCTERLALYKAGKPLRMDWSVEKG